MTAPTPINRKTIEDAIYDCWKAATDVEALWRFQNRTKLPLPFATLHMLTQVENGHREERIEEVEDPQPHEEVSINTAGLETATLSVNVYASTEDPNSDARAIMDKFRTALSMTTFLDPLRAAGIAVTARGAMNSLDEFVDSEATSRVQMDVTLCLASNAEERVGYIATAEVFSEELDWDPAVFDTYEEEA